MEAIYQDIPRIYTALAEWLACIVCISILEKKVDRTKQLIISGVMLLIQITLLYITQELPLVFWIPSMLMAISCMYLFLYAICSASKETLGYYCAKAFLLAEFAASLEWQLHSYIFVYQKYNQVVLEVILFVVVYFVVFTFAWYIEYKLSRSDVFFQISLRELISAIIIVVAVFSFSNLSFVYSDTPFSGRFTLEIFNIRTLIDLGGLAILYAFQSRIYELKVQGELSAIQSMLKNQYDQYLHYQQSIELINIKYHDIKHQIAGLRAETDPKKKNDWIDAIEKELELYETSYKTGNTILDNILAQKILYCKKYDIRFTCVVDGTDLEFIKIADICTIFGNAFDNAIESLKDEEEADKRLIHLSTSSKQAFIFIQMENYHRNEIYMQKGLPLTTKKDKKNHGFGLKSIKYTVEKYGGTISIDTQKDWFKLKIIIPKSNL